MTKYKKVVEEEGSKRMQWCCQAPCLFQLKKILPGKLTNPFERKKTDLKIALRRLKAIIMKRNMLTYIIIHMDLHCLPQCTWHHCTVLVGLLRRHLLCSSTKVVKKVVRIYSIGNHFSKSG